MLYSDILGEPFTEIPTLKTHCNIPVSKTVFLKMNPRNSKETDDIEKLKNKILI